jgi:hypothetical protein
MKKNKRLVEAAEFYAEPPDLATRTRSNGGLVTASAYSAVSRFTGRVERAVSDVSECQAIHSWRCGC